MLVVANCSSGMHCHGRLKFLYLYPKIDWTVLSHDPTLSSLLYVLVELKIVLPGSGTWDRNLNRGTVTPKLCAHVSLPIQWIIPRELAVSKLQSSAT